MGVVEFHMYAKDLGDRRLGILYDYRGGHSIEIGLWWKSWIIYWPSRKARGS